ncbi:uncharacterized protein [Enoplosus armatus]|uniref:uncharacterized protein n=1 Tax=Enoplosus armatus TaxID=215367 RepID=UPI0039910279
MSVHFYGWEVVDNGASCAGVELGSSQTPQKRGVYKMYHGTSVASARLIIANGFNQSSGGLLGKGVYVSREKRKADHYGPVILELRVRVGRIKRIDRDNHPMQYTWHAHGYDTAWVPPNIGLKAVPSGLEEDCVFDPKRVKVVGIAKAPSPLILTELQQLLSKKSKKPRGRADVCSLCKRKTQQGSQHIKQNCWKCGKNICTLMSKHVCPAKQG